MVSVTLSILLRSERLCNMRIKNRTLAPPPPKFVPLPRPDGDVILQVQAVLDYTDFDRLCPFPKPPVEKNIKTGQEKYLTDDPAYKRRVDVYANQKFCWIVIKSLEATEDLIWDSVDINQPETWSKCHSELASCFTPGEVDLIMEGIAGVNAPSKEAQRDALERFMSSQADAAKASLSPTDEQNSTPSLESVNVSG